MYTSIFHVPYILWDIYTAMPLSHNNHTEKLATQQTLDYQSQFKEIQRALYYSKEKIQQIRNERLREILIYAKSNSAWYKKSLAHIDVTHFTEERMEELPIINKTILMENWDTIVTNPKLTLSLAEKHLDQMNKNQDILYLLDHYHVLATSGTSGKRGVFIYDWDEWIKHYAYMRRFGLYNSNRTELLIDRKKTTKLAQVVICNTVFGLYSVAKTFNLKYIERSYFPVTLPLQEIIAGLNQTNPDILQGTPTTIYNLCLEAQQGNLHISPKLITVTGEALYPPIRQLIYQTWPQVNIYNMYGSSEGICGVNCRSNSETMHLNDDVCIVEPRDERGNPVKQGDFSRTIYLTNLYNYTLPLIRYAFSEKLLFLDKPCECGIAYQLIAEPQGRPEFDFTYANGTFVHHLVFVTPLLLQKNIREYQVTQTKQGVDIKILSIGYVDKNQLQQNICSALTQLGLVSPQIHIIEVNQFDYLASGKLQRFVKLQNDT